MKPLFALIALLILLGAGFYFFNSQNGSWDNGVACTMEAKLCPDGSYVGRVGPKCEFAACPSATTTDTTDGGGGGILPYKSGVRGVVLLGPTCPVERIPPDPRCADKPYQTLVAIFRASDPVHAFVITKSDASGKFEASLPPGSYTLGAGESNLPRCDHPEITVGPDTYVTANISCDTGIR